MDLQNKDKPTEGKVHFDKKLGSSEIYYPSRLISDPEELNNSIQSYESPSSSLIPLIFEDENSFINTCEFNWNEMKKTDKTAAP